MVVGRTRSEEAQTIGVEDLGKPPAGEGFAEVLEVVPSGVRPDETAREIESGCVVHGEQEGLLGVGWPPLVDGTVVLPELSDVLAAEASVNPGLAGRRGHQMRVVRFDVGLDRGARPAKSAEAFEFIGDELVVGRILKGKELLEQASRLGRPVLGPVSPAGLRSVVGAFPQEDSAQFVEPGAAHSQMRSCRGRVEGSCVEVCKRASDEPGGMAVG